MFDNPRKAISIKHVEQCAHQKYFPLALAHR